MSKFNKHYTKEANEWEQLKCQKRINDRIEQIDDRKKDNHRIFIVGALVLKIIPVVSNIEVYKGKGSAAKNAASFRALETFLTNLADDEDIMAKLTAALTNGKQ